MHRDPRRFAARPRYWIDRLLASDPSLERWRSGVRALLTAGAAAGVFLLLTRWFDLDYPLALAGIVVPVMALVSLQDTGRRQQQISMAWVPFVASPMLVLGTVVADNSWMSGGLFLLTIFVAFQLPRFGPRAAGLGTIAYQSFFYALLFKNPAGDAAWLPLFVFIGCAAAWVVHFWIVPARPGALLRIELRAYRARIAALLHDLGQPGRDVDAQIGALNDQSLALDARVAGHARHPDDADAAGLRDRILRCELAVETIAAFVRAGAGDATTHLRAAQDAVAGGRAPTPSAPSKDGPHWRLARAAHTLATLQPWQAPMPALRDDDAPPAPSAPGPAPKRTHKTAPWFDATSRRALQASASALCAMLAGYAVSPDHWYWAVFAAFIVFTRTMTVGQTVSGAWRQILASGAGLCLGVLVAKLADDSRAVELGMLFLFVALGFYAFRGLQNVYTALLTAMLAMLYELMGMDSAPLLALRLGETAVGAISAVLVARLILPKHTGDASDDKSAALLRAASALLDAAFKDGAPAPLYAALRAVDLRLQALRQALGPVTGADYPGSTKARRRHLDRLARIAYCVRHARALLAGAAPAWLHAAPLQASLLTLRARLDGVTTMLEAPVRPAQPGAAMPALAVIDVDNSADVEDAGAGAGAEPAHSTRALLAEADTLLRALQDELTAPHA